MYHKKMHLHFIGIGGIGMSGIAKILRAQGYRISGCDVDVHQQSIIDLQSIGCQIYSGNNSTECQDSSIDLIVYSSAVTPDNPEIIAAQRRGIPTIKRALMLAELMRTKYSIAIAGAHGKTTTTSLISHILIEALQDPTVIIGGVLKTISTNAHYGMGDFLVAEADESDRTIAHLQATLAVVTNINLEHLETYKDLDDIKKTFLQFLNNLPFYGKAILCLEDAHIRSLLPSLQHIKKVTYGLTPAADVYASNLELYPNHTQFLVHAGQAQQLGSVIVPMPGKHNVLNALAAIAVALDLGISFTTIVSALAAFGGVERRFSYMGMYKGAELFDDYGHHPEEIRNSFLVARQRTRGKLIVLFQPHRYSRTQALWQLFITVLLQAPIDYLVITDIYGASERPIPGIESALLVRALQERNPMFQLMYVPMDQEFTQLQAVLDSLVAPDDLVLCQGAGRLHYFCKKLAKF